MARKKAKPHKAITVRQRKLANGITKGLTIKEAGTRAGYASPDSARGAYKTLRLRFHPELERAGFNLTGILRDNFQRLLKMREAKKTELVTHQGVVMEKVELEDNATRLRAINDVNRYIGAANPEPDDPERNTAYAGPAQVSITLVLPDADSAKAVVAITANRPADHQQSGVDAVLDQDPGRSRSEPSV